MNALQKQREHYKAVRERLWLASIKPKPVEPLRPRLVYDQPVGPNDVLPNPLIFSSARSYSRDLRPKPKSGRQVILETAFKHGLLVAEVLSDRRVRKLVDCRYEIFWELRTNQRWSLPRIGMLFRMDHSSILHGVRKHEQRMRDGA